MPDHPRPSVRAGRGLERRSMRLKRQKDQRQALEVPDTVLSDPFLTTNYLGHYECKLCRTRHTTLGSYGTHIQSKRHQSVLQRIQPTAEPIQPVAQTTSDVTPALPQEQGGLPQWRVRSVLHPLTGQKGVLVELSTPQLMVLKPTYRIVSALDQTVEAVNLDHQYVVISCHPYQSVGVKIPNVPIEGGSIYEAYDTAQACYVLQFFFGEKNGCE
ncbi:Splicing factor 3A subunit 2 [Giardia muris]|uniref:Splicing factor 3A subunit 2 n=1 Tax=Giardia muris TaxID=5742 RepID=A0A4Z1SUT9_GIAMU|nr:Splicing factor 3A subunit 2 [Giardia muris]|eukprot:TNJ29652.1 Splicing factor 3A subunit 2 [Giardia muris]